MTALATRSGNTQDDQQTTQLIAATLEGHRGRDGGGISPEETLIAAPLEASDGHHGYSSPRGDGADNLVAASLTSGSHPESNMPGRRREDDVNLAVVPISGDALRGEGEAKTPSADAEGNVRLRDPGLGVGEEGDPAFTMAAASPGAIAFHVTQDPISSDEFAPAMGKGNKQGCGTIGVAVSQNQRGEVVETDYAHQLTGGGGKPGEGYSAARVASGVRRLTPVECERLQGLPDGWTDVPAGAPDSRRYSALGDAVTANVAEWIGRRLLAVEASYE